MTALQESLSDIRNSKVFSWRKFLPLTLFLAVNVAFVVRYASRATSLWPLVSLLYVGAVALILWIVFRCEKIAAGKWMLWAVFAIGAVGVVVLQTYIDPYNIKVDRWSAIHNPLHDLLAGLYPYGAHTHLGGYGSPFPLWQLFHLPFYLLGNVGLSIILAAGLYVDAMRRQAGSVVAFLSVVMLYASPAFWYEVAVRSDMLANFLVVLAVISYMCTCRLRLGTHLIIYTCVCGMLLSSRLSVALPLAIFVFPAWIKEPLWRKTAFLLGALLIFLLTFAPLLIWGTAVFTSELNPFVLQSRQGNVADFLVFLPVGIWLALTWRSNVSRLLLHCALLLLLLVSGTFLHNYLVSPAWLKIFDLTYFNMALPFLISAFTIATCGATLSFNPQKTNDQ